MGLFRRSMDERIQAANAHLEKAIQDLHSGKYREGAKRFADCVDEHFGLYVWLFKKGEFVPHILVRTARMWGAGWACWNNWDATDARQLEQKQRLVERLLQIQNGFFDLWKATSGLRMDDQARQLCQQAFNVMIEEASKLQGYADDAARRFSAILNQTEQMRQARTQQGTGRCRHCGKQVGSSASICKKCSIMDALKHLAHHFKP